MKSSFDVFFIKLFFESAHAGLDRKSKNKRRSIAYIREHVSLEIFGDSVQNALEFLASSGRNNLPLDCEILRAPVDADEFLLLSWWNLISLIGIIDHDVSEVVLG